MGSVNTIRRRVSIRNGMSIVKEVENARNTYQLSKTDHFPKETTVRKANEYHEADELIERLHSVNIALSAATK
ncbi:hypothetical protein QTG56_24585 (plasmid) [Rossellomorea sp. AcN35-11]|nr:hypothetical protein [Rossellomorea aquimaris]WJV31813.1 hypothetical protein QTG56_24585 [Rossellomorea sp. AcN35-11]